MDLKQRISGLIRCGLLGLSVLACLQVRGSNLAPLAAAAVGQYPFHAIGQVTSESGETATGTLIADRLVLTSAASFFEQLSVRTSESSFSWFWQSPDDSGSREYAVKQVHLFDNFLSSARNSGLASASALRRSLMVLELNEPVSASSIEINVETISTDAYRMVAGYAADLYLGQDSRRTALHATRAGEVVWAGFGRVEGRLYQTGDLKAAKQALGGPVISFYDGQWSIDGLVVHHDAAAGEIFSVGFDRSVADFIASVFEASSAVRNVPEFTSIEQDPNGSRETAIPLIPGTGRLFSIAPQADVDHHRFEVARASNIVIESFGDFDVSGRLMNASGQLVTSDDDSGPDFNYRIDTLLEPGTYYLLTTPYSGTETGDYGIRLQYMDAPESAYLDDGFTSSMVQNLPLDLGNGAYRIASSGEVDWFRVLVANPGHFVLQASGEMDLKAKVFEARAGASAPFASSDIEAVLDANDDFTGRIGNPVLDVFLPTGEYVVAIEARNAGEFGPYMLSTAFYGETLPLVNGDDGVGGFASAQPWKPGVIVDATFDTVGDRDTYVFTLDASAELLIQITSPTDVAWFLYDASLRQLDHSGVARVDPEIRRNLSAGTYYLMVAGFAETEYSIR